MVRLATEQLGPELASLLERVAKGEDVVFTRGDRVVATLQPVRDEAQARAEALENLQHLQAEAEASGGASITMDDIDALIAQVRRERRLRTA